MTGMVVLKTNLPDFKRQMQQVSFEFQRKSVAGAASAGARVFKDAVKKWAALPMSDEPRTPRTGRLVAAVYMKRNRRTTAGRVKYFIGVRSGPKWRVKRGIGGWGVDAFYWKFLEGGWFPRGPGKSLKGGNRSRELQRARLRDSGARFVQYQFIKPAFYFAQGTALDAFEKRMEREVRKLNEIK